MGYVTKEMIDRAKEMDLLTYLQTCLLYTSDAADE